MSIIRTKRKKHNFSIIDNSGLKDKTLSWKATGMLAYLMTKPDNWQISVANLTGSKSDKRDSTICALDQLQKAGYVYHKRYRDEGGRFQSEYLVFETQEDLLEWQAENPSENDHNGKTVMDEPQRKNRDGKTATEKPYLLINKEVITDLTNYPPTPQGEKESEGEKENLELEFGAIAKSCSLLQEQTNVSPTLEDPVRDCTSAAPNSPLTNKYVHPAQKCDDRFKKTLHPWRNSDKRNDFKEDFLQYLRTKHLPNTSHYKSKQITHGDTCGWITTREDDDKGLAGIEARWGDYLQSMKVVEKATPLRARADDLLSKAFNELTMHDHQTLIKQMREVGEEVFKQGAFNTDYLRNMKLYRKPLFEELTSHVSTGT